MLKGVEKEAGHMDNNPNVFLSFLTKWRLADDSHGVMSEKKKIKKSKVSFSDIMFLNFYSSLTVPASSISLSNTVQYDEEISREARLRM